MRTIRHGGSSVAEAALLLAISDETRNSALYQKSKILKETVWPSVFFPLEKLQYEKVFPFYLLE